MKKSLLTLLFLSVASSAFGAEIDRVVGELKTTDGAAYLRARAKLSSSLAPALDARVAELVVDRTNWRDAAYLAIADVYVHERAGRDVVLRGIDPHYYLRDRVQNPTVSSELRRLRLPPGVLFEMYLETFDSYPFAAASAYPAHLDAPSRAALRERERSALRQGLIDAIGATGHPAAPFLLGDVLANEGESIETRSVAAAALGATGAEGASEALAQVARGASEERLRTAAIAGLGHHRDDLAFTTLRALAESANTPATVRATAIAGLGAYATRSARTRVGATKADRAALVLVALLERDDASAHTQKIVEALGRTNSPAALKALQSIDSPAAKRAARRIERRMR